MDKPVYFLLDWKVIQSIYLYIFIIKNSKMNNYWYYANWIVWIILVNDLILYQAKYIGLICWVAVLVYPICITYNVLCKIKYSLCSLLQDTCNRYVTINLRRFNVEIIFVLRFLHNDFNLSFFYLPLDEIKFTETIKYASYSI